MALEIVVRDKGGSEQKFSYDKSSVMIGRAAGNDILLVEGGVSRYHARLFLDGDHLFIEDLKSTNGTFVKSAKVEKTKVATEDAISIGDYVLNVSLIPVDMGVTSDSQPQPAAIARDVTLGGREAAAQEIPQPTQPKEQHPGKKTETRTERPGEEAPKPEKAAAPAPSGKLAKQEDEFYWKSLESFLKPIWKYIIDEGVSEIMVNGPEEIYIESKGKLQRVSERFSPDEASAAVLNIAQYVGRRVSEDEPYLDARLPDGSRVAILLSPCSRKGTSLSIRKFSKERLTIEKLMEFGSMSQEMVTYLKACVMLKKNIIVSGGTSSGKTSLLNVVSGLIPEDERIITIEDSAELQLSQDHVLPMETKPPDKKGRGQVTIRDLVRASLRMRPDRIIVGEIRSGEALDLLQAMNTGHSGSMATVHASSPAQALTRLETLSLFSGIEIPMRALREQVSTAIEVIIQASRLPDHSRKVVYIAEVTNLTADGSYQVNDVFRFKREGLEKGKILGKHVWTGYRSKYIDEMELSGLTDALELFQGKLKADS